MEKHEILRRVVVKIVCVTVFEDIAIQNLRQQYADRY